MAKRKMKAKRQPTKRTTTLFRKGDAVRVKPGTACPDAPDLDIGGWQGRVTDLSFVGDETEPTIGFAWDSVSLQAMPGWFIEDSEREGLDWREMYLSLSDIEPAEPRDMAREVAQVQEEIAARYGWLGIGPEGKRIQAVVNSAKDSTDDWQVILAWEKYLKRNLRFPFEVEVCEFQEYGSLQAGDRLTVLAILDTDDLYGVIVSCRKGGQRYDFPLADLVDVDDDSPNAQLIRDYRVWFANR